MPLSTGRGVLLHPHILLNISDHATRSALKAAESPDDARTFSPPVWGILLGHRQGNRDGQSSAASTTVLITSYELPFGELDGCPVTGSLTALDPDTVIRSIDWDAALKHAHHLRQVVPELSLVGWYALTSDDQKSQCPLTLLTAITSHLQHYIHQHAIALPTPSCAAQRDDSPLPCIYALVVRSPTDAAARPAVSIAAYASEPSGVNELPQDAAPVTVVDCPLTLDAMEYIYVATCAAPGTLDATETLVPPRSCLHQCETALQHYLNHVEPLPSTAALAQQVKAALQDLQPSSSPPAATPPIELLAALAVLQTRCAAQLHALPAAHDCFLRRTAVDPPQPSPLPHAFPHSYRTSGTQHTRRDL